MDLDILKQTAVTKSNDRIASITCFTTSVDSDTFFIACDMWLIDDQSFADFNPKRLPKRYEGK